MDTRKIIDYAADDNAKEMREALYASIYDRVTAAFEEKRKEVASNLLGLATEEKEAKDDEDEEKDDDKEHEDEDEDKEGCEKAAKKEVKKHEKEMHD